MEGEVHFQVLKEGVSLERQCRHMNLSQDTWMDPPKTRWMFIHVGDPKAGWMFMHSESKLLSNRKINS